MTHRCFISFKKEDEYYRDEIARLLDDESIPRRSLDRWIDSADLDYVMQTIRENYMKGTSVTLYLIGEHSSENEGLDEYGRSKQSFMIRELQATLYDRKGNKRSGLLGIVLPEMTNRIFLNKYHCPVCGKEVSTIGICDDTVLREFSKNYWLKENECGHYSEDGRFCVLVSYEDFMKNPEKYINEAYEKTEAPIANCVHYRDIEHIGMKSYR